MSGKKISQFVGKTIPADADLLAIVDTEATPNETKKVTWANIKATLKIYNIIRKTADEIVNNSTNLQDDDELKFAVGANEIWLVRLALRWNSPIIPDIKTAWSIPSGASIVGRFAGIDEEDGTIALTIVTSGNNQSKELIYLYVGGSTAGTVQLQWAQNTANASDTKVLANSLIIAHRIV